MDEQSVIQLAQAARAAGRIMGIQGAALRDAALQALTRRLEARIDDILAANAKDVEQAQARGTSAAMLDRLRLTRARVLDMVRGVDEIRSLPDPVGEVVAGWTRPKGLEIQEVRVPLGVVAVIYESRPNVTIDVTALCLKSGNAVILKGGSDALNSNRALVGAVHEALAEVGLITSACQLLDVADRSVVRLLLQQEQWIDVAIPRGGEGLIREVVQNSRVPVIRQYKGVCHIYVAPDAEVMRAIPLILNAKCQRPGTCNSLETLLVDEKIAAEFLPEMARALVEAGVEMRGCDRTMALVASALPATELDWDTEYLDLILSIRIVDSIDVAIRHINAHGSGHSESILTNRLDLAHRFQHEVDAACVYVNASTRFTDGGQFGFGAEVGISTGKLHSRGPMGIRDLTTRKFLVRGDYASRD